MSFRRGAACSLFDIRLESPVPDVIVLTGTPEESPGTLLKGKVLLSFQEGVSINRISLRFYGRAKVSWIRSTDITQMSLHSKSQKFDQEIFEREWNFLPFDSKHRVGAGNYEYNFETVLPGGEENVSKASANM